ncbi:MAG: ATP-binding cassette domain-containing protein [Simkania negevensis]|nr:ATP-binding cassette domain-containing protein [Simkania negevensis]
MDEDIPLFVIKNLKTHFQVKGGTLKAVDDLSLEIYPYETLGIVGESGCGKTTLGRTIMGIHYPTSGEILFQGQKISALTGKELKRFRRKVQYIFQDPYSSLNPRMSVGEIIAEPLLIHTNLTKTQREEEVESLLDLVGLDPSFAYRFPHEFSGGQRQRISIARALVLHPLFIICDEPIAALDASIQAQIVNLLQKLREEIGLTYLFISHDLSMVKYIADRVAVLYLGQLMELSPSHSLYHDPKHPYTQSLIATIPIPDPKVEKKRSRIVVKGEVPSAIHPPKGCPFNTRCPKAFAPCFEKRPAWTEVTPEHYVACHLYSESECAKKTNMP